MGAASVVLIREGPTSRPPVQARNLGVVGVELLSMLHTETIEMTDSSRPEEATQDRCTPLPDQGVPWASGATLAWEPSLSRMEFTKAGRWELA